MPRKLDGIYQEAVEFIHDTWRNNPFRIPILMLVVLITTTASLNLLYNPQNPAPTNIPTAKANTYQFVPTAGNLVTGTAQNANSLLAAAAEGVNTGSWKGTLADDNFHWQVTAADSGTPNLNMQLDLGTAKLANANKLLIQTEVDLDSASRTLLVQICDWVSSTSVDAAADSECTTGGWRTLNSQNASNADVAIALTTGAAFQWHIFDGYFSSGSTGGGTVISTPLTNFTSSDTQPIRIRYWSDADVVGTADVAIDFLRANAFVDSVYHPAGFTNLGVGTVTGIYANTHVVGNTATAQQSVTAGNAISLDVAGVAGSSISDSYLSFKNVKTYTGMNAFYFKSEYYCSATGINFDYAIRNFTAGTWENITSASIACSTTAATHAFSKSNITPSDYIDEAAGDEVRIRMFGSANAATTLRQDFAYLMAGSVNSDSAQCEITWGTGTATNCTNTRGVIGPATMASFANTAETESNTANNDYYALDCDNDATAEQCSASNINFPVTVPTDGQVVVNHFAGKFAAGLDGTNPDMTVQLGFRDYSGTPTTVAATGGWTQVGGTSTNATQVYTDTVTALAIGTYGNQANPDDHVDTSRNLMNLRLRTTASGATGRTTTTEWDFAFVSIGWVVDSSHPTRNYQFAPTSDTLVTGTETARLAQTAAANTGVNTGGWQGTLGDDNLHWTIAGANAAAATNFDLQLNFTTAKQNGANKLLIQTEFDTDLNISALVQICDWVSSTSVDTAADAQCTTGGWRTINSQNASNADVAYTGTTAVVLQWHIFDGYFTTGTTGGTAVSTPLTNFFHSTNGVKIRYFSTTQTATNIDVDFLRIQPIIDTIYHPGSFTNETIGGGNPTGTYANTHIVGNTVSAQQSVTAGDGVSLDVPGAAGNPAQFYFSFKNVKTYSGMNTIYVKAEYYCSVSDAAKDHRPRIYNFTSGLWEDLTTAAIDCSTTAATNAWAKNNITITDYINGGEIRVGWLRLQNSTDTVRLDFIYITVGSTNTDTADCAITFGTGTATNCSNTRTLDGNATASTFDNPSEEENATMGTGDANSYHAFDNETTPDVTAEESTSSNISFPVTQPTNSSIVGQHYASRFSACGFTGTACGTPALTVQQAFKDYSGFNAALGGWSALVGITSASSTLTYSDTIISMAVQVYGQQANPEDHIDTANNKINLRLRPTTPGVSTSTVTTAWDFAMVSIQWIEIGNTVDISGSSSVTGLTVAVAVDGLLQVGKTATSAGGSCPCAWTISSVFVAGDRPVLVWHDAATDANESSGITVYDGSGNITGMQLTAHTLSVGSVDDQNTDSTDLIKFDNDADEDVMYKFVTTTLTVDATSTYTDDTIDILAGDTLTIGATETMLTYNTTINGTLTSGGATTYTIQGDWVNNGTFNEGTSTVTMNGTTSEDINSGCSNTDTCTAQNFYNLTLNKTDASSANDNLTLLTNGLRITNTLTLTDGELIQGALNIRVEGTSAVSIAATGTWTNISTGDLKLGGTFVNNGQATFNSNNGVQCVDGADDIAITSTSGGSVRTWSGSGTETIYNVAVTDMADSTVTAYTSSFTNTTWTVGSCGIAITGTCDQYDQTTDCTDDGANQFRVAVNGSIQAQVDTVVDGTINITGVTAPSTGDIITVFIDGEATDNEEAVAVTKYDGTGDVTGIVLYWRHLTIGSADNQTLANADIDAYDNSVSTDEDIFFEVNGTDDLTVDAIPSYSDEEIYIVTGNTYRPASAGGADVTTVHVEIDGTWTADSNVINVDGNWQNDGTFTANTSTANFTSSDLGGRTLSGTMTGATGKFNDINFNNANGFWGLSAAIESGNDFTVTNGSLTTNNNAVTVGRDFTLANNVGTVFTAGSSTINVVRHFNDTAGTKFVEGTSTVNQTGTGNITVGNGGDFNNLSVGYSGFTTTFSNNNWDMFGTITFNGGSVAGSGSYIGLRRTTTGSSVVFASATTLSGTQTLYHIGAAGSITYTITGGNYGSWGVVPYSAFNSNTYTLGGNFTSTGYIRLEADTTLTGNAFNTGTNYSMTTSYFQIAPCAPSRTGSWAIDFNDSSIALSSTTNSLYVGTNCGSHTLDLDTSDVTVNGSVSFVDGTTTVSVTPGTSDFTFAPAASQTETYTSNAQSLWNMTINGANSAATVMAAAAVDVNNNFTITAGTYDTDNFGNFPLTIGNNYSNSGTFTARAATVTFDATDTGNTLGGTMTGTSAFYDLAFGVSGSPDWTPSAAVAVTHDLTMTAGSLLGTQNITVNAHVQGTAGIINLTGGTFEQRLLTGGTSKNFGTTSGSNAWTFNDLTFSNGCTICSAGTITTNTGGNGGITVSGVLNIGKSGDGHTTTLDAGNRTWTLSGTGGDPFQLLASPAGDLTPATSTFTFTGNNGAGNTKIQIETYNNLTVNNASETYYLEGTSTVGANLTITAGTLDVSDGASTYNLTITGSYSNSGDFNSRIGTVTFNATTSGKTLAGQMTGSADDFYNLVFDGVSGAWGFSAAIDVANDFTVNNGAVTANSNNLTVARDYILANTTGVSYTAGSSTITVSRDWSKGLNASFSRGTSTVQLNGTGQILAPGGGQTQFENLTAAYNTKTTTMAAARTDVFGVLTLGDASGGTMTCSVTCEFELFRTAGADLVIGTGATLSGSNATFQLRKTTAATVTVTGATNYGTWNILMNTDVAGLVTYNLGGAITTSGYMQVKANASGTATFNTQNYTINADKWVQGDSTSSGATASNWGSSTAVFSRPSATDTFYVNSNGGTHTADFSTANISATGNVRFVNGTGTLAITPGTSQFTFAPPSATTTTYAPNGQSLHNVVVNGSGGTIQPNAAVDVNGNFTITAGTYDTVTAQNYALTVGGNFANSGTFTAQNGTVTLDGTTTQTVSGTLTGSSAFYNLTITNASGASASDCERTGFTPSVDFSVDVTATNNLTFTTANTRIEYDDGNTYTFNNINWNGQATGTRIFFRNSATSGTWLLKVTGTQTAVSYINVSRSDASVVGGSTINASDGTNVDCTNNTNWNFGTPTFEQSAYRFANNENGTTVNYTGSPAQDTAVTVATTGQAFRLRLLLHVGASNVALNGETFKLQYGEKTAANCTTGVSWGDVSPSSGVIRFKDNTTPADADNLTTNGGDPTHSGHTIVAQDYEEANNFTNSVAAINAGQDGLWDFSLENNSAVGGKRYCFKAVKSTGTDLNTYTSYPEVIIDEELVFSLDATSKNFGVVQPGGNPTDQTSTVTVSTNAATGYVVYAWSTQAMTKGAHTLPDWTGTNASPTSFPNGSFGFGYSTDDSTLTGGTADRFTLGGAKFAGFVHSGPGDPVADRTSGPVSSQSNTITYRLAGDVGQQAGTYTTVVVYVVATTF